MRNIYTTATILASMKELLIDKYRDMEEFCLNNFLHLQPKKCGFICINSDEITTFTLKGAKIIRKDEILYLGSLISCSGNITDDINDDIKLEIESNLKHFNKFYALTKTRMLL